MVALGNRDRVERGFGAGKGGDAALLSVILRG